MCFPGVNDIKNDQEQFNLSQAPYKLSFKDVSGYFENCSFCGNKNCENCTVPRDDSKTVADALDSLNLEHNDTFYSDERSKSGKELQLMCIWHQDFHPDFFNYFSTCVEAKAVNLMTQEDEEDGVVRLIDCLKAFKQSEVLDEDNMWYCNKC